MPYSKAEEYPNGIELMYRAPAILRHSGYLQISPEHQTARMAEKALLEIAAPGAIILASSWAMGFVYKHLTRCIQHPAAGGIAIPIMNLIWGQALGQESLSNALKNALPNGIDLGMTLLRGPYWLGELTPWLRRLEIARTVFNTLRPEFEREYQKWQTMDKCPIETDSFPSGFSIFLERNLEHIPFTHRITIEWQNNISQLQQRHDATDALVELAQKMSRQNISGLRIFPVSYDGKPSLWISWLKDEEWGPLDQVRIETEKHYAWWTEALGKPFPVIDAIPKRVSDPLAPVILEKLRPDFGHQLQLDSQSLSLNKYHIPGLTVFSGPGHFNLWLTPGRSSLLVSQHHVMPQMVLQSGLEWDSHLRELRHHIAPPLLPGWSSLPYNLSRVGLFYLLRKVGWYWGSYEGEHFERRTIFPGSYKKWRNIRVPERAKPVVVELSDGNELTGYLMESSNQNTQKSLIIVYHTNNTLAAQMAGFGNIAKADDINPSTLLSQYIDDNGVDVFFPEYRAYNNPLKITSTDQFLQDALSAFDTVAANYSDITVMGYSLGSGPASHVAANRSNVSRLILLAPFAELRDISNDWQGISLPRFFMSYHMNNAETLGHGVSSPVYLFHGERDRTIPIHHSEKIKDTFKMNYSGGIHLYRGGRRIHHDNILDNSAVQREMITIFQSDIPPPSPL
ncbi:lysophospholipase [Sansalvadorimonas sp. 2012CJ34-2]|uniref:Lysophospholipase n=1 Tax=Parendozoicomonas callyspongiae TaxID=2942213 RepID=A0ABT0PJ23_9GAMM|nr:lysophospholipase [Sansalvadorimonas sp. 2012CJ34-2]MCL6271384.1 lysophospholipase [Sansalvadorimonas sp. 2012CJ34-2]